MKARLGELVTAGLESRSLGEGGKHGDYVMGIEWGKKGLFGCMSAM